MVGLGEVMGELWAGQPLETANVLRRSFGGDTCNVVVAAARMGTKTAYLTALGDDAIGAYIQRRLAEFGVDTKRVVTRHGLNTGVYLVDVDGAGERRFAYYRKNSAATTFSPDDLDLAWLRRVRLLHISGISQAISRCMREAVNLACETVLKAGGMVSYDTNYRPQLWPSTRTARMAIESLPAVSLFAPSGSDLEALYPGRSTEWLAHRFHDRGSAIVFVKAGPRGAYVVSGEFTGWVPAPRVRRPHDTTAAGDAAVGVLVSGLLRGLPLRDATQLANRAAAFSIRHRGSTSSLPDATQIDFPR
jgi:2-dehydro-3-deoxygluconokinase